MHTTEPHALQAILQTVNDPAAGDSIRQRWTKALGCKPGNDEFARRHSEVVSLLAETSRLITTLPPEKQANYAGSVNAWWQVVISPDKQWGTGGNRNKLIGVEHIQMNRPGFRGGSVTWNQPRSGRVSQGSARA